MNYELKPNKCELHRAQELPLAYPLGQLTFLSQNSCERLNLSAIPVFGY